MASTDISERIVRIVQDLIDPNNTDTLAPTEFAFGGERQLDSVWALQLVLALEKEFSISIEDSEVTPENFQNFSSLIEFVTRKLGRAEGAGA